MQQVDELFISRMKGCALRIRQSTVKQCVKHDDKLIFVMLDTLLNRRLSDAECVKHDDKLIFVQVLPRAGLNSRNDSIYRIVTVFI